MSFYQNIANIANSEITNKGRSITYRSFAGGVYTPSTDSFSNASTDTTIFGVFTDYSQNEVNDTLIMAGDKLVIVSALDFTTPPKLNDFVIDGSDYYKVLSIETVKPASIAIIYKLQVRK